MWAIEKGITAGTSANTFSPDDACTRAQVATFLWRAQGKPVPTASANPFNDVNSSAYYYSAVLWAVEHGITYGTGNGKFSPDDSCTRGQIVTFLYFYAPILWAVQHGITYGTSATTFSPEEPCTRAQIVTFLWRACGSPEPNMAVNPFKDVASSAYYYKAVMWAVENGITAGTSANTFSPDDACTRGQVATFLWRAQGKPAPTSSTNPFSDVKSGMYYYDAVLWAVEKGITYGTGNGKFSPDDSCTRGQIVTFLYRALN